MPQPSRSKKRKRVPEEFPSSATLEVIAVVRRNGLVTKKRTIEKTDFDPRASSAYFPDNDDTLPSLGSQAVPQSDSDVSFDSPHIFPSRSVSVGVPRLPRHHPFTPPSRLKSGNGSLANQTTFTRSFAGKPPLLQTLPATDVDRLRSIVVSTVPLGSWYARVVCFRAMRITTSTKFRYIPRHLLQATHTNIPQKWNGRFFEDTTLTAVGLVVSLPHHVDDTCTITCLRDLMVFDLSGVHRLVVRYCDCPDAPPKDIQLLREGLFPATTHRPATAFSFNILDFFHTLQSQNKCNPYDFYHAIIQRADAARLSPQIVCFPILLSVTPLISSLASL